MNGTEASFFSVNMIKKDVVAAMLPRQEHLLPLSNLDLLLPAVDVVVFFCYKKPKMYTFPSMVNVLKTALAHTLASYYPFAGEIVMIKQNSNDELGEPQILCNNYGVEFVEAFTDHIQLKELNLYNPHESVDGKLIPIRKQGVLAIQVTQFKCEGSVVCCTFDHRVADAYSANMFLASWAEMARTKSQSQLPSFQRSLLFPRSPGAIYDPSVINAYVPISLVPQTQADNFDESAISRIYYVKANQISELQSLANSDKDNQERKKSKLEAFSAFLWKIIAEGKDGSNGENCKMGIVVDGRTRFVNGDEKEAKKWMSYFGNVVSIPFGEMKIEELKNKPINLVANVVREVLRPALTKEHFLGLVDLVELHRPQPMVAKIYAANATKKEPAIVVSSGQRFPVQKMDFGFGDAIFGSYHFAWGGQSGYVMPMPSPSGNGDWVVYMHLMRDQIEWIETFAAHVFRPLTFDFLNNDTSF